MSDFYPSQYGSMPAQRADMAVDVDLRSFMIGIYNKVAVGLVVSAVLLFAGLIAHDTQRLKLTYYGLGPNEAARSAATSYGALSLYISFINLFQFRLSLFGQRRD